MIDIALEEKSGVCLVRLGGRLDSQGAIALVDRLSPLMESGVDRIVLNFKEVRGITGAGLKALWQLLMHMRRAKGKLVLCSLSRIVSAFMDVAGFCSLFHIVPDEPDAWTEF